MNNCSYTHNKPTNLYFISNIAKGYQKFTSKLETERQKEKLIKSNNKN